MKFITKKIACSLILTLTSLSLFAETQDKESQTDQVEAITTYSHQGESYPPILFQTNIEDGSFTKLLESYGAFEDINDEAYGLPIGIRVLKGITRKNNAGNFSSALLSASTLGIIPVVSNKAFKVRYDVFVQGKLISEFEYEMSRTEVENFWTIAHSNSQEMKPVEELFLDNSVAQFLTDLKQDPEVQELFSEYFLYYEHL